MRKQNKFLRNLIQSTAITLLSSVMILGSGITAFADASVEFNSGYGANASITFGEALAASPQGEYYSSMYSADVLACPVYYLTVDSTFVMPVDGTYIVWVDPWDFETCASEIGDSFPGKVAKKGDVCRFFDEKIITEGMTTDGRPASITPYEAVYSLCIFTNGESNNDVVMRIKLVDSQMAQGLTSSTEGKEVSGTSQGVATWTQDSKGWRIQNSEGSSLMNAWYQDTDGKWYYMGADGYMQTNTTTPDGYKVGADGVWIQ